MIPSRSRRCVLAVPGSSEKMAAKAAALDVDQVMLDLEDAIADVAKLSARAHVIASLRSLQWSDKLVSVRVNGVATEWFERDVLEIATACGDAIDSIVLPKVEAPSDIVTLALLLARVERERGFERRIAIEPQIESARGLISVEAIAASHERVASLTFGPADNAASVGSPTLTIGDHRSTYPGYVWQYPLSRIVSAAKARGIPAIDGPYGVLDDADGLERSAAIARSLGCDGKWAIHPRQVAPVTRAFGAVREDVERARRISERYARAAGEGGTGAVSYEGELIDAASARLAQNLLRRKPHSPER